MEVYEAILKRRSIRSFKPRRIKPRDLRQMVNAARMAPSAANLQFLEYLVVTDKRLCKDVFKQLKWAGYIAPRGNPKPGCEPMAYIIILVNTKKSATIDLHDIGAACLNIMLTAQAKGIASCWLGAIDRANIRKVLTIPDYLDVDTVIALGYSNMVSKTAPFKDSIKYYLDKKGILHVPKRPLDEILHWQKFNLVK